MRWVNTRVLPEPAPAITSKGPSVWVTASRWAGLSPESRSLAITEPLSTTLQPYRAPCDGLGLIGAPAGLDPPIRGRAVARLAQSVVGAGSTKENVALAVAMRPSVKKAMACTMCWPGPNWARVAEADS